MTVIHDLISSISAGQLISESTFDHEDLDLVLDERDEDDFDAEWPRCNDEVQAMLSEASLSEQDDEALDELAQRGFMAVSEPTDQHDIASYVSDDFRLIGEALLVGHEDPWLSGLLTEYVEGRIPHGDLTPVHTPLASVAERLR